MWQPVVTRSLRIAAGRLSALQPTRTLAATRSVGTDGGSEEGSAEERLRQWVEASGGTVHPGLRVGIPRSVQAGVGTQGAGLVAATALPEGLTLTELPAQCFLTAESACTRHPALTEVVEAVPEQLWPARLGLAALAERAAGDESPFASYIQLLPVKFDGVPIFFGPEEIAALQYAPVQHQIKLRGRFLHEFATHRLLGVTAPFGGQLVQTDALGWGFAAASSRAFGLAGPSGPRAMLPLIDMANHSFVGNAVVKFGSGGAKLVTVAPVAEGDEILISYGEHPNDHLLLDYGFVVGNNPRDSCPIQFSAQLVEMAREMSGAPLPLTAADWKANALEEVGLCGPTASLELHYGGNAHPGLVDPRLIAGLRVLFAPGDALPDPGSAEGRKIEVSAWRTSKGIAELLLASFPTTATEDADALAAEELSRAMAVAHEFRLTKKRLLMKCVELHSKVLDEIESG
eukprot:m.13711 g.13711  ORF g.13711 m.13711 type:complete len:459 (-) comp4701_c0_seq1:95-1471(-)